MIPKKCSIPVLPHYFILPRYKLLIAIRIKSTVIKVNKG